MPCSTIMLIFRLDIEYSREYSAHNQRAGPFSHAKRGSWPHNLVSPNITTSTTWKHAPVQDTTEQKRALAYTLLHLVALAESSSTLIRGSDKLRFAIKGNAIEFPRRLRSNLRGFLRAFCSLAPSALCSPFRDIAARVPLRKSLAWTSTQTESRTSLHTSVRVPALLFALLFLTSIPGIIFARTEVKTLGRTHPITSFASETFRLQGPQNGFGLVAVGTTAPMQTLTYQFSSAATLSAVDILTVGAPGLDYTDAGGSTRAAGTQYTAGNSCTVNVAFTPSVPGMRAGAVTLFVQGSKLPLMSWYLNGIGQSGSVTIDPGTQATIGSVSGGAPYGSVVDGAGNVYVVDHTGGQVIEFAAGSFAQSTLLTGLNGPTAAAIDGAGNLYASDTQNNQVVMVPNENGTLNGTDMIVLSISGLGSPHGIAVDGNGNLYVADVTNGDVLEVPTGGGTPVMVAQGLTGPHGVAVDAGGNVYVATNNAVTEYPFGGGTAVPLGSGYSNPRGLAVDAAGNVYVADTENGRIVEVAAGGASQSTLSITGLTAPQSVSLDAADNLYVTDSGNVYEVNRTQAAGLVFSATSIGSTSTAQTITVSNNGNQALTVTSLAVAANFIQEPSAGTDCSSSTNLSPGGQCLIAVAFTPMQSGVLNGTLTLIDNALNNLSSTQLVQLSGSGLQLAQMITFTANAPATAPNNSNFTVAATASSNLPVVYTSTGACTNSGATYTMTSSTGTCTVIANQPGNSNYSPSPQITQATNAVLIGSSISTTSLNSIIYPNQSTALTATVSGAGNGGAPSGTVSFMLGANTIGTGNLSPNGPNGFVASVPLLASQLKLGANSIDAVYSGDSNYTGSTSPSITVTLQGPQSGFGSAVVGTTAPTQTLTYQFSSTVTLSAVDILTVGAPGLDYTDAGGTCAAGTQYTAGNSCTVNVAFTPSVPGMRAGPVTQ